MDPLGSFAFASCKLSDQQMARIALLVYARRLHRGTQVRKPAKHAVPQSLRKHLGNAAVPDRQERGIRSEEMGQLGRRLDRVVSLGGQKDEFKLVIRSRAPRDGNGRCRCRRHPKGR